jgi:hypothetical protein
MFYSLLKNIYKYVLVSSLVLMVTQPVFLCGGKKNEVDE